MLSRVLSLTRKSFTDADLLRVFDELEVSDDRDKAYDILYKSLFDRAINKDESDAKIKKKIAANNHISLNNNYKILQTTIKHSYLIDLTMKFTNPVLMIPSRSPVMSTTPVSRRMQILPSGNIYQMMIGGLLFLQ